MTLGRERWRRSTGDPESVLGKSDDTLTSIERGGIGQRPEDEAFLRRMRTRMQKGSAAGRGVP